MPVNALRKDIPRGTAPPRDPSLTKEEMTEAEKEKNAKERELAALETEALWESEEVGLTRWSGGSSSRYGD